jgi:hypothetical protein
MVKARQNVKSGRAFTIFPQSKLHHMLTDAVILAHKAAHVVCFANFLVKPYTRFAAACGIGDAGEWQCASRSRVVELD